MFTNLFSFEEREDVVEFVEEETIETVEELDTFVDKVIKFVQELGQVVVNTGIIGALLVGKAVKCAVKVVTYPVVKPVKLICNKVKEKRNLIKMRKEYEDNYGLI